MSLDLNAPWVLEQALSLPWQDPAAYWGRWSEDTAHLSAPVTALDPAALLHNARDLRRRAGGLPLRVASKSLRSRPVLEAVLALPGFSGVLAYSLAEAVWLSSSIPDIVVGYPSVDAAAYRALMLDERAATRVTVMIDSEEQLNYIDSLRSEVRHTEIRVCLDLDASYRVPGLSGLTVAHLGVRRSPVRTPHDLSALAQLVLARPGFRLVGVMSYEAQIAGVANGDAGLGGLATRAMQRMSQQELRDRRGEAVAAVRERADLEFVNGGGTGSLAETAQDGAITEIAAGSGLFGPGLFDGYLDFTPAPAVAFALDVVRRPTPEIVTLLGGGWVASGPPGSDRLPSPTWPSGLRFLPREGAGEVQTPLTGANARNLRVGDRVWFRHAKSGEVCEHTPDLTVLGEQGAIETVPTYRGEGRCFL